MPIWCQVFANAEAVTAHGAMPYVPRMYSRGGLGQERGYSLGSGVEGFGYTGVVAERTGFQGFRLGELRGSCGRHKAVHRSLGSYL